MTSQKTVELQQARDAAIQARADHIAKIDAAQQEHHRAGAFFDDLARQKYEGAEIASRALSDAVKNREAAKAAVELLQAQIPFADETVALATAAHTESDHDDKLAEEAIQRRVVINLGTLINEGAKSMVTLSETFYAEQRTLIEKIAATGRAPTDAERHSWMDSRNQIRFAVPKCFQDEIAASGVSFFRDLGEWCRAAWGAGAAPDDEVDAPYKKAADDLRNRIGAEQRHAAAGREQAARGAPVPFSFTPGDMGGVDPVETARRMRQV